MKTIKVGPRTFISPPYIKCPKCGKERFGILLICHHHYCRRCKECLFPGGKEPAASYPLPELNKKIIYIDQMAISNMMKALNPQTKTYQKGALDEFWLRLFKRLDSLCKLQLIVCPASSFHTDESLLSKYFEPLKRMYELLSHGISFHSPEAIQASQLNEHALNWISGKPEKELTLHVRSVVHGEINAWQNRFMASPNLRCSPAFIDGLRKARNRIHKGLSEVFKQWQSDKNMTFDDWFEEECTAFGKTIGRDPLLTHSIQNAFIKAGVQESDILPKTVEYLKSSSLKDVAFIRISCMLFAALARKAAAGRKKPPNQGMDNDISIISFLLPYYDAMFIDNECHGYLKEMPLCDSISYGTAIFSQNTKDDFLNYLDEIELRAPGEHLDKVNEVYGKSWREPFTTIYREQRD